MAITVSALSAKMICSGDANARGIGDGATNETQGGKADTRDTPRQGVHIEEIV